MPVLLLYDGVVSFQLQGRQALLFQNMAANDNNKDIPEAAKRALQEAAERRKKSDGVQTPQPKEIMGRDGPDPVRFGDWEKDGIISDF